MIIKNPIDKELSITFRGIKSTIPASGILHVEDNALVDFWKATYGFIIIESSEDIDTKVADSTELVEDISKEIETETTEEITNEKIE